MVCSPIKHGGKCVRVPKRLFDRLRQHCEHCPDYSEQLQDLSDGHVVAIPDRYPSSRPYPRKRKILRRSEPQDPPRPKLQQSSQPLEEPASQLPSQLPTQLPSPSTDISQSRNLKRAGTKEPQRKPHQNEAADWFLRKVPKATEWRKRQTELELNIVEQYEEVIRAFTDRTNVIVKREPHQRNGNSKNELVDLAERFALLTKDSLMNAKLQRSFARFQALILLSYCEVLMKRDVPYGTIDRIIQHITNRECDRKRLLDSALWINGVVVDLVSHGWTIYRATELFFIGVLSKLSTCEAVLTRFPDALSIFYLARIHNDENLQSILKHLKTDKFTKYDYSDCLGPEYTIPGLIASLLDACSVTANKLSIDEICIALGYNSDLVPKSVESIYKVHAASKSTPVTSVDLHFDVLGPDSFQTLNPYPPVQQSVQSMTKSSTDWRNTVMNPQNNHRYSCNHQPFLSTSNPSVTSIETTDFYTDSLLILLYSLGCSEIRKDMLFRGLFPQKRWNDHGNVHEVTLHDGGLNEQVVLLFSSQIRLEQAIKSCIQLGLIEQGVLADGSLAYSLSDQSRHQVSQSFKREELSLLGLMFTAHVYPQDETLEPSFRTLGKLFLPHLERTWQNVQGEPRLILPAHARDSLIEASLAVCRFVSASTRDNMFSVLAKIQDTGLPDHLRMAIAIRQSISLRLKGDHDRSDVVIRNMLESIAMNSTDIRSHCSYGRLLLSRTENAILRKEFNKATSYLASWEVKSSPPSELEFQLVRMKNTVIGRVSRYEGQFIHARQCLEQCLKTIPSDASRYHVMHHLADVYCELGISKEAEILLLDKIEQLRTQGEQRSKRFRRLVLPLAEAYIEQRTLVAARTVLRELLNIYDGIVGHDVADQLGLVRSMIGLARVDLYESHWFETRHILESALGLTEKYQTFSEKNFYIGVIHLFLSIVRFKLRQYPEARRALASANDILYEQMPRHFMPGMGTYFLEWLVLSSKSLQWPSAN